MGKQGEAIMWIAVAVVGFYFLKSAGVLSFGKAGQQVNASGVVGLGGVGYGPVPNNQTGANIGAAAAGIGAGFASVYDALSN